MKLFNLVRPDRAYFGQKDAQQASVVRRMVLDLAVPVEIRVCPTARDDDGLALSSRNVYLSAEERQQAPLIQRALSDAEKKVRTRSMTRKILERWIRHRIEQASLAKVDYAVAVDPETLIAIGVPFTVATTPDAGLWPLCGWIA